MNDGDSGNFEFSPMLVFKITVCLKYELTMNSVIYMIFSKMILFVEK